MTCPVCGFEMLDYPNSRVYRCTVCRATMNKLRFPRTPSWPLILVIFFYIILLFVVVRKSFGETIEDCGPHGNAKPGTMMFDLNPLKNRFPATLPLLNNKIDLQSLLRGGNDTSRFNVNDSVSIVGYVAVVKPGGPESCNCGSRIFRDVHIALVSDPKYAENDSQHVVVEMTPRVMQARGWTVKNVKKKFLHRWVRISGLMFNDLIHKHNALNTNPQGSPKVIWRRTSWEVHPVLSIELVNKKEK